MRLQVPEFYFFNRRTAAEFWRQENNELSCLRMSAVQMFSNLNIFFLIRVIFVYENYNICIITLAVHSYTFLNVPALNL
jgi:hypothetical protein